MAIIFYYLIVIIFRVFGRVCIVLTIPVRGCDPNFTYLNVKARNYALRKMSPYLAGVFITHQRYAIKGGIKYPHVPHTLWIFNNAVSV